MGKLIVYTDASFNEVGATEDFTLDINDSIVAQQDQNNDFALTLPISIRPPANSAVFVDGTEWGGLVQKRSSDTSVDGLLEWRGRTWHGVLADRVLEPDAGQDYNVSSGTVSACITDLLTRLGLTGLFAVGTCPNTSIASYQHKRYPTGLDALFDMLASVSLRPKISVSKAGGKAVVLVGAESIETHSEEIDGATADVAMLKIFTSYNHIIGLGEGELSERIIVHRYANSSGAISSTKSITGLAERVYKYDYPNAEEEDLIEAAEQKLKDLQGKDSVSVDVPPEVELHFGDYVSAYDPRIDESVTARVTKCTVKVKNGIETCAWSAGE